MTRRRKQVTMVVTVSCPPWLTAAQARKEVRSLINEQAFWGHRAPGGLFDECEDTNFRAVKIAPERKH